MKHSNIMQTIFIYDHVFIYKYICSLLKCQNIFYRNPQYLLNYSFINIKKRSKHMVCSATLVSLSFSSIKHLRVVFNYNLPVKNWASPSPKLQSALSFSTIDTIKSVDAIPHSDSSLSANSL